MHSMIFVKIAFIVVMSINTCIHTTQALSSSTAKQRIALVTGSNKGIGLEIVRKLGAEKKGDNSNAFLCILGVGMKN